MSLAFRLKSEAAAPSGASEPAQPELCYLWDDGGEERLEIVDIRFVGSYEGGMELLEAGGLVIGTALSVSCSAWRVTDDKASVETLGLFCVVSQFSQLPYSER